jgi:hypothetical protein
MLFILELSQMRKFVFVLFLSFVSCQSRDNFVIVGHLPDKTYDNEKIYLVPIENPGKERVDSIVIKDGLFKFTGKANVPEIFVIRAKPVLRFNLEELLIVRQPGNLSVEIDNHSSVRGTPLNDSLQQWKEQKMKFDFVWADFLKKSHQGNDSLKLLFRQKADSVNKLAVNFHYRFVLNNKKNIVGQFVNKMMGASFTEGQKKKLNK